MCRFRITRTGPTHDFSGLRRGVSRISSFSGRTSGVGCHQASACHEQVRETEQREQLRGVLGQSAVAGLAITKQVLHDMERVLDLRPDPRFGLLVLLLQTTQAVGA